MQLSIKKLRIILSISLLIETRSIAPKIVKLSGILLKPVPVVIKSIQAWVPATAGVLTTHALSGATTEVKSPQGNSINIQKGQNINFQFYTSRYTAGSFSISGLPDGLTYDGSNSIVGTISAAGNYSIQITGYRGTNQSGSSTPPFSLEIVVADSGLTSHFPEISDLGNNWYKAWVGTFFISSIENWVFHSHLGWLYAYPVADDSFWFFDNELGWLYTSKDLYPYFHRYSSGSWLYHFENTSTSRFWDFRNEVVIH